ncbi:TPA: DUF3742 family protein [Pseudomonas aeruginosa]|uniref:DUF3742 family protein n=1 Tax=Pseudomonas aeruginosa TaxID=287 RepID=UPI000F53505E|nr:DUF3742 family protein [Pseudomonas aeruginosa]MBU8393855.1 DUF3742 family protein [Pseudomonas aeruginosa]RPM88008.1 hypothetical protein IPC1280_04500 [Pseudomonas aeruginosa]RPS08922.1 hypothetical protein IPC1020_04935 [Pseudomonas aeruginosa]HCL3572618.1 DUF3742 family protein [Pseudomonas aeruginosa]
MRTAPHISTAERFGRWLGRGWRGYARREGQAVAWLAARGVPKALAIAASWAVKLTVVAALLYVSFWIALLCVGVAVAARGGSTLHDGEESTRTWPFTDINELRRTPGYDPNLYNDITDVNYTDD